MADLNTEAQIGRVVHFSCEPYHFGTGRIIKIEEARKGDAWAGFYNVTVAAVEAVTVNRLFGAVSRQPVAEGEEFELYRVPAWEIEKGQLRYVYPV